MSEFTMRGASCRLAGLVALLSILLSCTSRAPRDQYQLSGGGHGGYDGKSFTALADDVSCADGDPAFARIRLDGAGIYRLTRWNCAPRDEVIHITQPPEIGDTIIFAGKRFNADSAPPAGAPSSLRYSEPEATYLVGRAISANSPALSGAARLFQVSPPLPAGLSLHPVTGVISGTPISTANPANYAITASNASGSTAAFVRIRIARGYQVDSLADLGDAFPGDSNCATSGGACTLRGAIQEANASPASNDVILLPAGTIALSGSEIPLASNLEIIGSGQGTTIIDGQNLSRIFNAAARHSDRIAVSKLTLQSGRSAGDGGCLRTVGNDLVLSDVTFRNCFAGNTGGGLSIDDDSGNQVARLTMSGCTIRDNTADSGGGGGLWIWSTNVASSASIASSSFTSNVARDMGGGISLVVPRASLASSLISGNSLSNGASASHGGAALILWGGAFALINNTITGNTDNTGNGALHTNNQVTLSLISNTIVGNASLNCAFGAGGFTSNTGATVTFSNNLIQENLCDGALDNCAFAAPLSSEGGNLADTPTSDCGLTAPDDRSQVAAQLGALQNNGGPTLSMTLLPGSPGVDQGSSQSCPAFDQRGYPRVVGAGCDIGAVEGPQ